MNRQDYPAYTVIAIMWGWIDSESISLIQLTAMAGIIASVVMVQGVPRKRKVNS